MPCFRMEINQEGDREYRDLSRDGLLGWQNLHRNSRVGGTSHAGQFEYLAPICCQASNCIMEGGCVCPLPLDPGRFLLALMDRD